MENNSPSFRSCDLRIDYVRVVAQPGSQIRHFLDRAISFAFEHNVRVEAVFNDKIYKIDPAKLTDFVVHANAVTEAD